MSQKRTRSPSSRNDYERDNIRRRVQNQYYRSQTERYGEPSYPRNGRSTNWMDNQYNREAIYEDQRRGYYRVEEDRISYSHDSSVDRIPRHAYQEEHRILFDNPLETVDRTPRCPQYRYDSRGRLLVENPEFRRRMTRQDEVQIETAIASSSRSREHHHQLDRREREDSSLGFSIDTESSPQLLRKGGTAGASNEPTAFHSTFYRNNLLGASEEYIKQNRIQSYMKTDEKVEEEEINESPQSPANEVDSVSTSKEKPVSSSIAYISVGKVENPRRHRGSDYGQEQPNAASTADLHQRREQYNIRVRQEPYNVDLWREFVLFQDEDCDGYTRSCLLGKKIAILESALRSNPKSMELHMDRLDLMSELSRPTDLVNEWQKLMLANSDCEVIWLEKLMYSCTQIQLFNCRTTSQEFEKVLQKLRVMLQPSTPEYMKPKKLHLLMGDIYQALCIVYKNCGFMEKAIALCQAQFEFDFNFPESELKAKNDKSVWKIILNLFEMYWNFGTLRFGEPGYEIGWNKHIESTPDTTSSSPESKPSIGIRDSEVRDFEDLYFDTMTIPQPVSKGPKGKGKDVKRNDVAQIWISIESLRSKLYWVPWRDRISDSEDCEDNTRIILSKEIGPFLTYVESSCYSSSFEQESIFFRHIVNFLMTLSNEFLPRTHTLESLLPFSSISLSDSTVFFSELNYWEKFLELYYVNRKSENIETIPEGYKLPEFTIPSSVVMPIGKKLSVLPVYPDAIAIQKDKMLSENQHKYRGLIRNVVKQSINKLSSQFATLLVQMLFRYEQKSMYICDDDFKGTNEFCRNLMQHEKLRTSIEAFGELALLDYFNGRKKKAVGVLIKAVNSSSKLLKVSNLDTFSVSEFLNGNWKLLTEVTKLYRIIAEFHLMNEPVTSHNILVSLGNNFDLIVLPNDTSVEHQSKSSSSLILKAKRLFELVMDTLVPSQSEDESIIEIDCEEEILGLFGKWDGEFCIEFFCQKSHLIVEWTIAYALFTFLTENSFDSASNIYQRVMKKLEKLPPLSRTNKFTSLIVNVHNIQEQLYWSWCKLGAFHVNSNPMENGKFRTLCGRALEKFPSSPPLLVLYTTVENQCSVVGKLWRSMVNVIKQPLQPNLSTLHWAPIFMCYTLAKQIEEIEQDSEVALDEFGIGGPPVPPDTMFYKLDALLIAAEEHPLTRNCPLIWRIHLKHLAIRSAEGKDGKRARQLFYEAIRNCPTSKLLFMDAIAYFPEMLKENLQLLRKMGLVIRLPMEELDLLLQYEKENKKQDKSGSSEGEVVSDDNVDEIVVSD